MSDPTIWIDAKGLPTEAEVSREKTQFSPQIFCLLDRFCVVWVNANTGKLSWTFEEDSGSWSATLPVQDPLVADTITSSPSVSVLNGTAHLVYACGQEGRTQLFHLQLDTYVLKWGKRCGLGALPKASVPPSLGTLFTGTLHCVYRDEITPSMKMVIWTEQGGWTTPSAMKGVVLTETETAVFELNKALHLLVVDNVTGQKLIQHYSYDSSTNSWVNREAIGKSGSIPGWTSNAGVTATSVNDKVFAAFCGDLEMVTVQCLGSSWTMTQKKGLTRTPSIAVKGNQAACVVSNKVDGWMARLERRVMNGPLLKEWMADINPQTKISALTIPGAHDAGANSMIPLLGTQSGDITSLLNLGVRYFDIRVARVVNGWTTQVDLLVAHGPVHLMEDYFQNPLILRDAFEAFYKFLSAHPTEGLLVQVSNEAEKGSTPEQAAMFTTDFRTMINEHPERWVTTSTMPTVADLKGKIQLLRRFAYNGAFGIDLSTSWLHNSKQPFDITFNNDVSYKVKIQDYFSPAPDTTVGTLLDVKYDAIKKHLDLASADKSNNLYLNFASATAVKSLYTPWNFAVGNNFGADKRVGENYRLDAFFNAVQKATKYGVVLLDYPGVPEELILAMIKTNYGSLYPQ